MWCGLLWCFYQLFGLSFWRHPFTAEHPLVSKWCKATFLQIWWRNKLIYILRMSTFSDHLCFWLNYSFKTVFQPGQAGASGLTADISQNPFKTSKTVQLVKIRSHKGLLVCSEHQESLNAVHLQQLMISWELTLGFLQRVQRSRQIVHLQPQTLFLFLQFGSGSLQALTLFSQLRQSIAVTLPQRRGHRLRLHRRLLQLPPETLQLQLTLLIHLHLHTQHDTQQGHCMLYTIFQKVEVSKIKKWIVLLFKYALNWSKVSVNIYNVNI